MGEHCFSNIENAQQNQGNPPKFYIGEWLWQILEYHCDVSTPRLAMARPTPKRL